MKQVEDSLTGDLLDGFKKSPGRPRTGKAMSAAERQARRREKLRGAGKVVLTVEIDRAVFDGLTAFVRFKDITKDSVVERVLRQQLLRKR